MKEIAVVTGASSGIGAATVRALAKSGYQVIAAARRTALLENLARENSAITAIELDVTNQVSVDSFTNNLKGKPVSILVNNAGGAFDGDSVLDSDPEIWQKTYDVNVVGAVRMTKAKIGRAHV